MSDLNTLDCDSVSPYLSAFADGELAEPLRAEVAAHVKDCAHCAAGIDRIHTIDQLVARLPHTAPSPGAFARTLAAATRHAAADPRGVTREALSGATRADAHRRLRQLIAPELDNDSDSARQMADQPTRRPSRAPWIAAAVPLVAALLLISLSVTLFNRFPSAPPASHPTPSAASPLQQTRNAVAAVANQLSFTPVIPTYLPDGAGAPTVRVGPGEQVQVNSRYLDITWTFRSGPAQSLHLRELPTGLGFYGYTAPQSGTAVAALAWSLPQMARWQSLTPMGCASCLAVGETRSAVQLALDAQPRGSASATAMAVWLRLVSLSLDAPYMPLGVGVTPPASSLALRYQAVVSDGQGHQWKWVVATVGASGSQQYARVTGNGVDITQIVNGGAGAQLDNTTHVYQPLEPPLPTAQPPSSVTQPLYAAGEFIATGELWNLGERSVNLPYGGAHTVYDLYRVNAAQPEHIYADATTGQIIALVVTTPSKTQPGGASGSQTYVSTTACQPYTVTYTVIQYVPMAELPATLFDTAQPSGWRQGAVTPAFTCPG